MSCNDTKNTKLGIATFLQFPGAQNTSVEAGGVNVSNSSNKDLKVKTFGESVVAIGKKNIVVDKENFTGGSGDRFRILSGKGWFLNTTDQLVFGDPGVDLKHNIINYDFVKIHNNNTQFKPETYEKDGISPYEISKLQIENFLGSQKWVLVSVNEKYFVPDARRRSGGVRAPNIGHINTPPVKDTNYVPELWKEYISDLFVKDKEYYDVYFEMSLPFNRRDVEKVRIKPLTYDNSFGYNFYVDGYETTTNPEIYLPNFYLVANEISRGASFNSLEQELLTLNGEIGGLAAASAAASIGKNYFEKYSATLSSNGPNALLDKYKNIMIPAEGVALLNRYHSYKESFPMCVDVEFSTDRTTLMSGVFENSDIDEKMMAEIYLGQNKEKNFVECSIETRQEIVNGSSIMKESSLVGDSVHRIWDITNFLNNINENTILENEDVILIKGDKNQNSEALKVLKNVLLVGKMKAEMKKKTRTFEEIMAGKPAYAETVLYRIEKFLADEAWDKIGSPIQNIYITNDSSTDITKFVDAQVKYGVRYHYDVYAYQMVFGTKYKYVDVVTTDVLAAAGVVSEPYTLVVEMPYFSFNGMVLDDAPVRPVVELVSYKGIDNKVLVMLQSSTGEYQEEPIVVEKTDREQFEQYRQVRNIKSKEITFKSDDWLSTYQVFRVDEEPKDYGSFSGRLLITIKTDVDPRTAQKATSAAFVDNVAANKKYWYMFRSVDIHKNVSQPTDIIQFEMINDNGVVYPIVREFYFSKPKEKNLTKYFRRYLYLSPADLQGMLNDDKSGLYNVTAANEYDANKAVLGMVDNVVWGKKYKLRITSRKTGKKVDVNLVCSYRGLKNG